MNNKSTIDIMRDLSLFFEKFLRSFYSLMYPATDLAAVALKLFWIFLRMLATPSIQYMSATKIHPETQTEISWKVVTS